MKQKKKKLKKQKIHVQYNRKRFLAPESIRSMAVIFTKIYKDGTGIIRISDCNRTIKIWNNLNNPDEVKEFLLKIGTMKKELELFENEVKLKLPYQGTL